MTTTPIDPRSRVQDAARDAVTARMRADVDLLAAAAEWAIRHPATVSRHGLLRRPARQPPVSSLS